MGELTYDETAKKLGARGAILPATIPNNYTNKPNALRPGIEGTTSSVRVPREFIKVEGAFFERITSFRVEHPSVAGEIDVVPTSNRLAKLLAINRSGLALAACLQDRIYEFVDCHVWVSCYEPSTTGWGEECTYTLFRTAGGANRHSREAFKSRIRQLRCISTPQAKFLQPEDEPGAFKRL